MTQSFIGLENVQETLEAFSGLRLQSDESRICQCEQAAGTTFNKLPMSISDAAPRRLRMVPSIWSSCRAEDNRTYSKRPAFCTQSHHVLRDLTSTLSSTFYAYQLGANQPLALLPHSVLSDLG